MIKIPQAPVLCISRCKMSCISTLSSHFELAILLTLAVSHNLFSQMKIKVSRYCVNMDRVYFCYPYNYSYHVYLYHWIYRTVSWVWELRQVYLQHTCLKTDGK